MPSPATSIVVERIDFAYPGRGGRVVFRDYSAAFEPGLHVLKGFSGCGKSTLLRLIAGYLKMDAGSIRLPGGLPPTNRDYQIGSLGFVFQSVNLLDALSIHENVQMAGSLAGMPRETLVKATHHWLQVMGIDQLANEKPNRLSGGQRQRAAFARAMVKTPRVLLLDEPSAGLDDHNTTALITAAKNYQREQPDERIIIIATHDDRLTSYADQVRYFEEGVVSSS